MALALAACSASAFLTGEALSQAWYLPLQLLQEKVRGSLGDGQAVETCSLAQFLHVRGYLHIVAIWPYLQHL